ncbi:MAG: family 1 encapsulin nanocompartment shell protein [Candidatus Sumerlaeia bacterium]
MPEDILRRSVSTVTQEAWDEIDEQAREVFENYLTGRSIVDFNGPHGWETGSVDVGQLEYEDKKAVDGVRWGLRKILPLMELRCHFTLNQMELDSISRGRKDADLDALEDAAKKVAKFEEGALYNGFNDGSICGMLEVAEQKPVALPASGEDYPRAITTAISQLREAGVGGPYALVLPPKQFEELMQAGKGGYPVRKSVEELLKGEILMSPAIKSGVVVSTRGGDFEMTVGQDLSIGYWKHEGDTVEFYITESFTFRVIEPKAIVPLKQK